MQILRWNVSKLNLNAFVYRTYISVPSTINADRDKVMILHPEFIKYVNDKWAEGHGGYPSTGFLTLIFALHICDEVNVFGFGATSEGQWHHYFDDSMTSFSNLHGGDFENQTIHFLHQQNKISLHKGWTWSRFQEKHEYPVTSVLDNELRNLNLQVYGRRDKRSTFLLINLSSMKMWL